MTGFGGRGREVLCFTWGRNSVPDVACERKEEEKRERRAFPSPKKKALEALLVRRWENGGGAKKNRNLPLSPRQKVKGRREGT